MLLGKKVLTVILTLEEVALNAWPALYTVAYDGWIVRMTNGYTRRANAVHPLYASTLSLAEKINACESLYLSHGLPAIFKLTKASLPAELDATLAARGYQREDGAHVMTRALTSLAPTHPAARIETAVSDAWLGHYTRLNAERARHHDILMRLFSAIAVPAAYMTLTCAAQVVGVGVAVAERGYVGLFGLAVDAAFRRQGLGTQLVETCLYWGAAQGAREAYLQVHPANVPGIALYEHMGFRTAYRYWYRQQPT